MSQEKSKTMSFVSTVKPLHNGHLGDRAAVVERWPSRGGKAGIKYDPPFFAYTVRQSLIKAGVHLKIL